MGCCRVGKNLNSMPYKSCGGESITLGIRRLQLCNLGSFLDSLLPRSLTCKREACLCCRTAGEGYRTHDKPESCLR